MFQVHVEVEIFQMVWVVVNALLSAIFAAAQVVSPVGVD
jgi:hypothetical protein